MSDSNRQNRSLSEISHLFLSDVRDRQTNGATRPRRVPPKAAPEVENAAGAPSGAGPDPSTEPSAEAAPENTNAKSTEQPMGQNAARGAGRLAKASASIDLSPEEFAEVAGEASDDDLLAAGEPAHRTMTAVLAWHLSEPQVQRVYDYARHVALDRGRVGLIQIDSRELKISCFDASASAADIAAAGDVEPEDLIARRMAETLQELSWDIDHWILLVAGPRTAEGRELLQLASRWTVLSTCDHDGVISAYRTLKGLADGSQPAMGLALLDAEDDEHAAAVHQKLAGVTRQFLDCQLEFEGRVMRSDDVPGQTVLHCRDSREKQRRRGASNTVAPQWEAVSAFLRSIGGLESAGASNDLSQEDCGHEQLPNGELQRDDIHERDIKQLEPAMKIERNVAGAVGAVHEDAIGQQPAVAPMAAASRLDAVSPAATVGKALLIAARQDDDDSSEVIELPAGAGEAAILEAVVGQGRQFIQCPVKPPKCENVMLAVSRDRRLTMLAVAGKGLTDLRSIGAAFGWLVENRGLVAMALPQFAIDAHGMPALRLLVDCADVGEDVLQPILSSGTVTVQAYRKLRWGSKTGLLLEAA